MAGHKKANRARPGRLRIVAGNWRSRLLDIADVEGLRPTSERIRETLFNWLAPGIQGARCLDLFAGTGALGLEALSRGAGSAVFVERSPIAVRQLRKNIAILTGGKTAGGPSGPNAFAAKAAPAVPPAKTEVIHGDGLDFLRHTTGDAFDIVFLDPPFAEDLLSETCRLLAERRLLAGGAAVYLELGRDQDTPVLPADWHVVKDKTAGNVRYMLVDTST